MHGRTPRSPYLLTSSKRTMWLSLQYLVADSILGKLYWNGNMHRNPNSIYISDLPSFLVLHRLSKLFNIMSFNLTEEHVKSFLEPAGRGDWAPFMGAIDPNVNWVIVDPVEDPAISSGTYVCVFSLVQEQSHKIDRIYNNGWKRLQSRMQRNCRGRWS